MTIGIGLHHSEEFHSLRDSLFKLPIIKLQQPKIDLCNGRPSIGFGYFHHDVYNLMNRKRKYFFHNIKPPKSQLKPNLLSNPSLIRAFDSAGMLEKFYSGNLSAHSTVNESS